MRRTAKRWIADFEAGKNTISEIGKVPYPIRAYLCELADNTCTLCGFHKQNPFTKRWIIEVDHIDGDWKNNTKDNLRIICPNCSAATKTYKALNAGRGRPYSPTRRDKKNVQVEAEAWVA